MYYTPPDDFCNNICHSIFKPEITLFNNLAHIYICQWCGWEYKHDSGWTDARCSTTSGARIRLDRRSLMVPLMTVLENIYIHRSLLTRPAPVSFPSSASVPPLTNKIRGGAADNIRCGLNKAA